MELIPYPFASLLAAAFIGLLGFVLCLNVFGLPANWIILALVALLQYILPGPGPGILFWIAVVAIALAGELLEFAVQVIKAKHYGSSSSGTFTAIVGAIAGAIILSPLFWGLGALIGALIGAWCGCLLMELFRGMPLRQALDAAFGAMLGRFLGVICKIGTGAVIITITARVIWPEIPEVIEITPVAPGQTV